jgi:phenylalanyl-tRNA synthetase beta chain
VKVTYNWLKDFVEIKISPGALADKLTMAGLEVTALAEADGDFVFEIEVTSNRPDCLSVIGIAREVAAITGKKLSRYPVIPLSRLNRQTGKQANRLTINIQDKKDCSLYTAKIIKDVKVGPSPDWLKERLELVGCRSINNIVDIANYIMFAWGEPLHAFDLDTLGQNMIIVRRAERDEKITTIDGEPRILNPDILVIADQERPVAIAGVMGGKDTEVSESTKNVLLEAAIFNPVIVRRVRQKLGLQSESAYRFERGIDLGIIERASWQAAELIQEIGAGRCVLAKRQGQSQAKKKTLNFNTELVAKILAVEINPVKIKAILNNLGFKVTASAKNNLKVSIPSHRPDVNLEMDLIEEIARIYGYERIPNTLPALTPQISASEKRERVSLIKNILVGLGLNEVITYSLVDKDLMRKFDIALTNAIEILNPLSSEQEILRPTLIPSLTQRIAYNLNQKQDYINIFEIANIFTQSESQPKEELALGLALGGTRTSLSDEGLLKQEVGLLHLKGIVEVLLERLGISNYNFKNQAKTQDIALYIGQEKIGAMLSLARETLENLDIKNKEVFITQISLDKLFSHVDLKKRFVPLPVYPAITRDISLTLKEDVLIDNLLETIQLSGRPLLREVKIIDYYKGQQIPAGCRGLTISCVYRSDERTLTEEEINPTHSLITQALVDKFNAKIR